MINAVLGLLMLCALLWSLYTVMDQDTLPIRSVKFEGDYTHIPHDALQQVVMPFLKNNFFTLDIARLKDALLHLPWVSTVSISRVWPNVLVIRLAQQFPVARWHPTGFLSEAGDVFTSGATDFPAGLPLLNGPDGQQSVVWSAYRQMTAYLTALGVHITRLDLTERQAWCLWLDNGMEVVLGRTDPYARLQRLVTLYPTMIGTRAKEVAYVDLRYTNGAALRWRTPMSSELPSGHV